ncbi:hypothetical protein Tco_0170237 [Tanacetum coccineum]
MIFRYLRGTINMGLWYPKDSGFELTAFSDANHAGCSDTRKSTSGGIQFLGDKLVSRMSKNQDCTTMSSTEAEYGALSTSCAQVMWMRTQLKDYGFNYKKIPLYYDSQSAIAISCNPVLHSRTKHIHTRYHFIKEQVENGEEERIKGRGKEEVHSGARVVVIVVVPSDGGDCGVGVNGGDGVRNESALLVASPGASTTLSYSPGPLTPPSYSLGPSRNAECSNCKLLIGKIKVLEATLEMSMHLKNHTLDSTALLDNLYDMEKFGLE